MNSDNKTGIKPMKSTSIAKFVLFVPPFLERTCCSHTLLILWTWDIWFNHKEACHGVRSVLDHLKSYVIVINHKKNTEL